MRDDHRYPRMLARITDQRALRTLKVKDLNSVDNQKDLGHALGQLERALAAVRDEDEPDRRRR
jgi:hypothetical protein